MADRSYCSELQVLSSHDAMVAGPSMTPSMNEQRQRESEIAAAVETILRSLGEDPTREGLVETPKRFARAMKFLTRGYHSSVETAANDALFAVENNDLVVVKDIEISSLCEHHLLPFTGKMYVGYIPHGRVLGLSKVARIAEIYSRRLQIQERLTQQVAEALERVLKPDGVAVVLECAHTCMSIRGVRAVGANTITMCKKGVFQGEGDLGKQFLDLLNLSRR